MMYRNRYLLITLLLAAILTLTACSNSDFSSEPTASTPAESTLETPSTEASGDGTKEITHLKGTSKVPTDLKRTVALSASYIDHLITIGEKPVGVNVETRYGGDYLPYLAQYLNGVATVGSADSPNLEGLLELEPEVILVESRTAEQTYDQLAQISPTIVFGTEWLDYESDTTYWTKDLLQIADMYNKTDLAKQKIAELDVKVGKAKEKVTSLENKKLAYLRVREKVIQIYASKGHPMNTLLYHDLGFEQSSLTPSEQREDLSVELIPKLDADYIFLEVDPNGYDNLKNIKESALWKNIPAVQKGNVYETDSHWLFKGWGALGRSEIIDDVLQFVDKTE